MLRRTSFPPRRGERGFTLVELIVVVVIAGILATLAAPSFTQLIENQRAKNAATDIYVALTRARSEALRLNQNVTMAPVSSNWSAGWQITDSGGGVLESHEAIRSLTVAGPASITYKSSGRTTSTADMLFTITGQFPDSTHYVCVDLSGRPAIGSSSSC